MKTKIAMLGLVATMLLTGCAKNSNVTKVESNDEVFKLALQLDKPIKKTKVYVNNELDEDRNNKIMDAIYNGLKNGELKKINFDGRVKKKKESTSMNLRHFYINNVDTMSVGPYYIVPCLMLCEDKELDATSIIKKDNQIIVKNFNSPEEILKAYPGILDELYDRGEGNSYEIVENFGVHVPLSLNEKSYEEKKLIMDDTYLKMYTLKTDLEKQLKEKGFAITNNPEDADIEMYVENLAFGKIKIIKDYVKAPQVLPEGSKGFTSEVGLLAGMVHIAGGGSTASGMRMFTALSGLGIAMDLMSNAQERIYTFNSVTVYSKDKFLKRVYINTPAEAEYGTKYINDEAIEWVNEQAVKNFIDKNLTIKENKKI